MKKYKDIINFSIINKLRSRIGEVCTIFNSLLSKNNIDKRESEFYEVYTEQYSKDMKDLVEIRNRCTEIVDVCNRIMFNMNTYNIKQYYLDKEELSEYEDFDDYKSQQEDPNDYIDDGFEDN